MNPEQKLFLALLRDHVRSETLAEPEPGTDWAALLKLADAQSLSALCYVQLRGLPGVPADALQCFHSRFLAETCLAVNRRIEMARISAEMDRQGIPFLPFKGWVVKNAWPVPELRSMGDVDFLIRPKDRSACDALMRALGFELLLKTAAVWTYARGSVCIEVHERMIYEPLLGQADHAAYFDRAWAFASPELDASFHLLYLLTHLAKHITNKGMGFRAFLDLVFWCRERGDTLRWDWIRAQLAELRLLDFAQTCFTLCRAWFGVKLPLSDRELDRAFFKNVTEKAFSDGAFGLENAQNDDAALTKEIALAEQPFFLTALRMTLRRIFPAYEDMRMIPWYRFLDGRPWLLPAAWVYRWFFCLFRKREQSGEILMEVFRKRGRIEGRMEQLRQWGL